MHNKKHNVCENCLNSFTQSQAAVADFIWQINFRYPELLLFYFIHRSLRQIADYRELFSLLSSLLPSQIMKNDKTNSRLASSSASSQQQ
jgi:hypothetical protein